METGKEILERVDPNQPSIESERQQASEQHERVMARLWLRMTEIYGHKWVSSYGEEPNESWSRCLMGLSADQVAQGMNALMEREDEWPPTATGFRNMCLGNTHSTDWEHRRQAVPVAQALEHKTPDLGDGALLPAPGEGLPQTAEEFFDHFKSLDWE